MDLFENLNVTAKNLTFLVGMDQQDLLDQIQSITLPMRIISIYAVGSRHCAWIQTASKIKKVTRGSKE